MEHKTTVYFRFSLISCDCIADVIKQVEGIKKLVLELDEVASFEIIRGNEIFKGPTMKFLFDELIVFIYNNLTDDGCVEIANAGDYSEDDSTVRKHLFSKSFILSEELESIQIYLKSNLDRSVETENLIKSKSTVTDIKASLLDKFGYQDFIL